MTTKSKQNKLTWSILSLSLLTVMAGAAVAPALNVIQEYFMDSDPFFVQMIISIPAIFIVLTNLFFNKLCRVFKSKTLVLVGLIFYTVGGCIAGLFSNIYLVLLTRALVGIGVGIIMPLSTGLLAFYFKPQEQEKLMGYSSAMNQMGGVIATLLAGMLSSISWRASFLVYLLGLISILLCLAFLPNQSIQTESDAAAQRTNAAASKNIGYIIAMFLLMSSFFIYPANFALETAKLGFVPQGDISIIMASMDFIAFIGGLLFVRLKITFKNKTKYLSPLLFTIGYALLLGLNNWAGILLGSACIGFANGAGIPYIISEVSMKLGKAAATTIMPLLSAALYFAQFLSPFLTNLVEKIAPQSLNQVPYLLALVLSVAFLLVSSTLGEKEAIRAQCH